MCVVACVFVLGKAHFTVNKLQIVFEVVPKLSLSWVHLRIYTLWKTGVILGFCTFLIGRSWFPQTLSILRFCLLDVKFDSSLLNKI